MTEESWSDCQQGARDLPLLQNYRLAARTTQSPVHWILRFISLEQA